MSWLVKIEKALFYFLVFAGFWQWRVVWLPAELSSALPAKLSLALAGQQFNEWTVFSLYATDLVVAAIFILWAWRIIYKKRLVSNPPKAELSSGQPSLKGGSDSPPLGGVRGDFDYGKITLYMFLLFCALSLFVASDKMLALFRFIKLLEFVGLYFYVRYNFAGLYSLKKIWQWFIAGAALQSMVAIAQFLTQQSLGLKFFAESPLAPNLAGVAKIVVAGEKIIRAYGLVPHPNILAAMLIMAIFGLVWLFLTNKFVIPAEAGIQDSGSRIKCGMTQRRIGVLLFIVIFALLSIALFVTFSRGVIIIGGVLFFAWLIYLWRNSKESRKPIVFICVILFLVSCFLFLVFRPYVSARYDPASLAGSQSVDLRSFYNQEAIKMIWQKPLLGLGLGNFVPALKQTASLPLWQYQPAHNIYLLIAAEVGLLALLAFLVFLFLTVRSVWKFRRDLAVSCLLFAVGCLLFFGLFDHFLWDLQQGQILFWLMLGLLGAHSSMDRAQASEA
ncbi:O-antigen ligase family protein [Patescibacteria group bacterium]|nr:O-antigen ligase family protein [Patescibacteria group bacterium]MBU2265262.1 O-antigen ligase family protein [Patescibacteria group bacterium]